MALETEVRKGNALGPLVVLEPQETVFTCSKCFAKGGWGCPGCSGRSSLSCPRPFVGAEHFAALLADADLVLAMDSYEVYPVAGDASPVAYVGPPRGAVLRPLRGARMEDGHARLSSEIEDGVVDVSLSMSKSS